VTITFLTYFNVHFTKKLTDYWATLYLALVPERSEINPGPFTNMGPTPLLKLYKYILKNALKIMRFSIKCIDPQNLLSNGHGRLFPRR
jgi:hypothetical protein